MRALFLALITLMLAPTALAERIARLESPQLYDLQSVGFELDRESEVSIDAVGRWPGGSHRNQWDWIWNDGDEDTRLSCYAWILDAGTREAVWKMKASDTERHGRSRTLREQRDEIRLEPGRYELYFWSGHLNVARQEDPQKWSRDGKGWKLHVGDQYDEEVEDLEADLAECYVQLETADGARAVESDPALPGALLRLTGLGDSELRSQAFKMKRDGELRAYVLVEHGMDSMDAADFAWIVDQDGGRWVWDSSSRRGRHAGGATKNRRFESRVRLEAGDYVLYYGTDDSHSYAGGFNSNPPDDPMNWGITLQPGEGFSPGDFQLTEMASRGPADLEFTKVGDGEFHEQAFRLPRETVVSIHALGEMDSDGWVFYDYGWIADAASGETVWEMDDRNCYPAGGAEKNRMFDGTITLPAGDYIAFYVSDDSHSAEEWNAGAPFEPDGWGMAIRAKGLQPLSSSDIQKANGVLVGLVRVGDHERIRERFELERETEVEVYALGEGIDGEMFDYGYIRDRESGKTVWEMDYYDTEHAGGARKNRVIRQRITLGPGRYEVIYESDGSHSFEGWNDRRPDDPMSWGITVREAR